MGWRCVLGTGALLSVMIGVPTLAHAQFASESVQQAPTLELARPSRAVLARRRAGWTLFVGAVPTFLVGFGIARFVHRNDEPAEWGTLANTFIPGVIAEGLFFAGMGLLIRSRRILRRERASARRTLTYELQLGPLGGGASLSF